MLKTYETKSIDDVRVSAIRNLLVTASVLCVFVIFRDIAQQRTQLQVVYFWRWQPLLLCINLARQSGLIAQ